MNATGMRKALSPRKVIKKYAPLVGGPLNARQIIALSLREGTLRARAGKTWISTEASLPKARKSKPAAADYLKPKLFSSEHSIDRNQWDRSLDFLNDVFTWDFRKSLFHITLSSQPIKRKMFIDVRFYADDVANIFAFSTQNKLSNFDSRIKIDEWRRFWHEMLIIVAQGKIGAKDSLISSFTNFESIIATIEERLNIENLARMDEQEIQLDGLKKIILPHLEFTLEDNTLQKEVDALRKFLGVKRHYSSKNNKLAMDRIVRTTRSERKGSTRKTPSI